MEMITIPFGNFPTNQTSKSKKRTSVKTDIEDIESEIEEGVIVKESKIKKPRIDQSRDLLIQSVEQFKRIYKWQTFWPTEKERGRTIGKDIVDLMNKIQEYLGKEDRFEYQKFEKKVNK